MSGNSGNSGNSSNSSNSSNVKCSKCKQWFVGAAQRQVVDGEVSHVSCPPTLHKTSSSSSTTTSTSEGSSNTTLAGNIAARKEANRVKELQEKEEMRLAADRKLAEDAKHAEDVAAAKEAKLAQENIKEQARRDAVVAKDPLHRDYEVIIAEECEKRKAIELFEKATRCHTGIYLKQGWYDKAPIEQQYKYMPLRDYYGWSCCPQQEIDALGCTSDLPDGLSAEEAYERRAAGLY